jgi:hypothetical protein
LSTAHVNDFHFADSEFVINVLGGFEHLCLQNVVRVALGLKFELVLLVFELLSNPLIFCRQLVVEGHLLGLVLNLFEFLFLSLELNLLLHFEDFTLSAKL